MLGKKKQVARNALGAALILAFTAAPVAFAADEKGWYMGASLGQYKDDTSKDEIDAAFKAAGATNPSTTLDDTGDAWKLFGGYQFTKNWAVEFAYVDFGKVSADTTVTGGRYKIESTAKGWSLAGVGTAMVSDNLGLFGKLGFLSYDNNAKLSTVNGPVVNINVSDSDTKALYGAGLKYNLTKQMSLRAEWEQIEGGDDKLITIGIQYKL